MNQPTLLVLAAGMGSRYGGLKQIDGIGPANETIIEYSIFDAINAGFGKVVFVIRKNIEAEFKAAIGSKFEGKIKIAYAFQELDTSVPSDANIKNREKPWGTAHAVLAAAHVINEPFAVINADDFYGKDAIHGVANFLKNNVSATTSCMIGFVLNRTLSDHGSVSRGICEMDENQNLVEVVERKSIGHLDGSIFYEEQDQKFVLEAEALVSMNLWGFHPSIFGLLEQGFHEFVLDHENELKAEFFIPLFVSPLVKNKTIEIKVIPTTGQWHGVTYKEDKPIVQKAFSELVEAKEYPSPLFS